VLRLVVLCTLLVCFEISYHCQWSGLPGNSSFQKYLNSVCLLIVVFVPHLLYQCASGMSCENITVQQQGNCRYQTLPMLCTSIIPFPADRLHRLRPEFSRSYLHLPDVLNDPFCCMTLLAIEWSLLHRTQQRWLQQRLPMLLWMARTTPKIAPSPWDFVTLPEED